MNERLRGLVGLEPEDLPYLRALGPLFAAVTGASIIVASGARAVFLASHPLEALPWTFAATGLLTALLSVAYVALIQRIPPRARLVGLLLATLLAFALLAAAFPLWPEGFAWIILISCPALAYLLTVQAWSLTATLLPTRAGKRLIPALAGAATLGGSLGGGVVPLLMPFIDAPDLLYLAGGLLLWPLAVTPRALSGASQASVDPSGWREIREGVAGILRAPLLRLLGLFTFLTQFVSVFVDYQFSGELKAAFERDELASILGAYYWVANGVIFILAIFGTPRLVRRLGLGATISATSAWVLAGSVVYLGLGLFQAPGSLAAMLAVAFGERVGYYALTRSGVQMLCSPLDAGQVERARTLIDGVLYRTATVLGASVLLLFAPAPEGLHVLAWIVILGSAGVVALGLTMGPHYRGALLRALRVHGAESVAGRAFRRNLGPSAESDLRAQLQSPSPDARLLALEVLAELDTPLEPRDLLPLLMDADDRVVCAALRAAGVRGIALDAVSWRRLLEPSRGVEVLREALSQLSRAHRDDLLDSVEPLMAHDDHRVAALAGWLVMQHQAPEEDDGDATTERFVSRTQPHLSARSLQYVAQLSRMIDASVAEIRLDAVEAMGQLRLADHIDPLVACLERPELRPMASRALQQYGAEAAASLAAHLRRDELNPVARLAILRVLEALRAPDALRLLMEEAEQLEPLRRSASVAALWRMADPQSAPLPSWLRRRLLEELERFALYDQLFEEARALPGRPGAFLAQEIAIAREDAEERALRLVGLLRDREIIQRAQLTYRSADARARSNALELLEQHLPEPELRPLVLALERRGARVSGSGRRLEPSALEWLQRADPWLAEALRWARRGGELGHPAVDLRDPVGRLYWLKTIPLFEGVSGEVLRGITTGIEHHLCAPGATICHEGERGEQMFVIVSGSVEVLVQGSRVALLGDGEYFGELALLDNAPRSATVRALEGATLLSVSRRVFLNLLEFNPGFAVRIIRVMSRRLRGQLHLRAEGG